MGLIGFFIIHPKRAYQPKVDKDFGLILQEWAVLPNNTIPNTMSMEFNLLTINGKAGPATTPLIVKLGERVRIRMVNLGMDHHPMHLHGQQFYLTGTEGGRIPPSLWYPENTVLVGVAQARVIEFEAKYIGDWMLHCHLPHHMMNQMVSMVGPPAQRSAGHEVSHAQPEKRVPGFPQDMWMPMDEAVVKPETYGMAKGWSGAIQGMTTVVRVMPREMYEKIMRMISEQEHAAKPAAEDQLSGSLIEGERVVRMRARRFEFLPSQIIVKEGERVRLEIISEDVTHGIEISSYGVNRKLEPGKTEIIMFTADKPGRHHFHCSVYCGEGHGKMHGELIVLAHSHERLR